METRSRWQPGIGRSAATGLAGTISFVVDSGADRVFQHLAVQAAWIYLARNSFGRVADRSLSAWSAPDWPHQAAAAFAHLRRVAGWCAPGALAHAESPPDPARMDLGGRGNCHHGLGSASSGALPGTEHAAFHYSRSGRSGFGISPALCTGKR